MTKYTNGQSSCIENGIKKTRLRTTFDEAWLTSWILIAFPFDLCCWFVLEWSWIDFPELYDIPKLLLGHWAVDLFFRCITSAEAESCWYWDPDHAIFNRECRLQIKWQQWARASVHKKSQKLRLHVYSVTKSC